jgi:hypothetical protein
MDFGRVAGRFTIEVLAVGVYECVDSNIKGW